MADDVWLALVKGITAFAHTRAGSLIGDSFKDADSLVSSLFDDSPAGTAEAHLDALKQEIKNVSEAVKPIIKDVEDEAKKAAEAVGKMAAELDTEPFTWEAAGRAATELAYVLIALDSAIEIIAKKAAEPEPNLTTRQQLEVQIKGITERWKAPFRNLAADASAGFDSLCQTVLGINQAGKKFAGNLLWSREQKRLALTLVGIGPIGLGPLNLDGTSIEAFFSYKDTAKIGLVLRTRMRAGLRSDKMLEKIIPGQAPTADTDSVAIALDTKDGLTFGEGPNRKITLPVRFSFPGLELREMSIARPLGKDENSGRIDLMVTIAGKLGEVFGVVAEGGGAIIRWKGDPGAAVEVLPKPPTGAGLRIKTGLVNGGGYLRYQEGPGEYGGVLDLKFTKIGLTAAGLITFDPFSLVLVMGVHFLPKIELSFGFTLNGLGGIIAINRTLCIDEMRKGLQDGALDQLLFPSDPIAAAPKILDRLAKVFPQQPDGVAIGPIAELGWGSQAGFVKAKIGIVLSLPDPAVVVLGVLQVAVPSPDAPAELRIVDLHAEVMAAFTPDYVLIWASLVNSKLAGITVSGDLALFIRWNGGAAFAFSAGGFFPSFNPPPELVGMKRIALEISPPLPWIKVRAEAYFAVTSNSVQFGGRVTVTADLGIVGGKAWVGVDALFQWSPRFYFIFRIDCGIELTAFGETVAGVSLRGELSGMKPWRLSGHASTTILFWDVDFDLPTIEWGERDTSTAPEISPVTVTAQALREPAAWTPQLPAGVDILVRFREDDSLPLLVHPLGALELKQLRVPLETQLDRLGSSPVTSPRVHLADPHVGTLPAQAVSHAKDHFAPGHFRNLTEDQQNSRQHFEEFPCGMRVAASAGVLHGPPSSVTHEWETKYPHEQFGRQLGSFLQLNQISITVLRANAASRTTRANGNPYVPPVPKPDAATLVLGDAGRMKVVRRDDLGPVAGLGASMTTTAATEQLDELAAVHGDTLQLITA